MKNKSISNGKDMNIVLDLLYRRKFPSNSKLYQLFIPSSVDSLTHFVIVIHSRRLHSRLQQSHTHAKMNIAFAILSKSSLHPQPNPSSSSGARCVLQRTDFILSLLSQRIPLTMQNISSFPTYVCSLQCRDMLVRDSSISRLCRARSKWIFSPYPVVDSRAASRITLRWKELISW